MSALTVHRQGDVAGNRVMKELAFRLALDGIQALAAEVELLREKNEALAAENEHLRAVVSDANAWAWQLQDDMYRMREELPTYVGLGMTRSGQIMLVCVEDSDADRDPGDEHVERRAAS